MHINLRRFYSILIYFILLSLIFSCELKASDSTHVSFKHKNTIWQNLGSDIGIFFTDWGSYLTVPLRMSGKDWSIGGGVIGGTLLSSLEDKQVKKSIGRTGAGDYNHNFWDGPTAYGDVYAASLISGGVYGIGWLSGNEKLRITGRMLIESIGYSVTLAFVMKIVIGRYRPYTTDNQYQFKAFQSSEDYQSFPSGHTTMAFAISTILAERINTWWSRVLFYCAAGLTAYARVLNNRHWFSDVLFGSALGFGTGWFVIHNENNREKANIRNEKGGTGFSFGPAGLNGQAFNGLTISYGF